MLELTDPERQLYLAISDLVHNEVFGRKSIQAAAQWARLALLVVNLDNEEVVQWIS